MKNVKCLRYKIVSGSPHLLRFRRQYATPVRVLTAVAASAGPTMADGRTLPYWLREAIILMGIS